GERKIALIAEGLRRLNLDFPRLRHAVVDESARAQVIGQVGCHVLSPCLHHLGGSRNRTKQRNPAHSRNCRAGGRRYFGKFRRMCNSRNCFCETSEGAPINRSSARWFIGNRTTSRRFSSPHKSITMRSTPGAMPPCGGAPSDSARSMPPNFCSSTSSP